MMKIKILPNQGLWYPSSYALWDFQHFSTVVSRILDILGTSSFNSEVQK